MFENDTFVLRDGMYIVFTGDLIDYAMTGRHVVFIVLILLKENTRVFVCNGNHEQPSTMVSREGDIETIAKCDRECESTDWYPPNHDYEVFNHIPHGLLFDSENGETVFFSHGTLPFKSDLPSDGEAFPIDDVNLLWSDYHVKRGKWKEDVKTPGRGPKGSASYSHEWALAYMDKQNPRIQHHISGHQDQVNHATNCVPEPVEQSYLMFTSMFTSMFNPFTELRHMGTYDNELYVLKENVDVEDHDVTPHRVHLTSTALATKRGRYLTGDAWVLVHFGD